MNCPFHVQVYKNSLHSYREFPLRWAECGTVYRFEKKGELSGLTRVRGFTQDDAHIICRRTRSKKNWTSDRFIMFMSSIRLLNRSSQRLPVLARPKQ